MPDSSSSRRNAIAAPSPAAPATRSGRSYPFQNPLRQNHLHTSAVQALGLGVPVLGRVVLAGTASFPQGLPDGVSQVTTLERDLRQSAVGALVPPSYAAAWLRLRDAARTDRVSRRQHLAGVRQRKGERRRSPAVAVGLAVFGALLLGLSWLRSAPWLDAPLPREAPSTADVLKSAQELERIAAPSPDKGTSSLERKPSARPQPPVVVDVPQQAHRPRTAGRIAEIAWSEPGDERDEACHEATVALLYDDSAENRGHRDRACGIDQSALRRADD